MTIALGMVPALLACEEQPPRFPADPEHLRAPSSQSCYDCHHRPGSPPMHVSHFRHDGTLKEERRVCRNCHRPVAAPGGVVPDSGTGGDPDADGPATGAVTPARRDADGG